MRVLFVHPSPLMYSEIYLRLEPLGMERVAAATRAAGHDVRILDLQIFKHRDLFAELESFKPQRGRLLAQLSRQRARGDRSRQGREAPDEGLLRLHRRAQRLVRRGRNPRACGRRDRRDHPRRGRDGDADAARRYWHRLDRQSSGRADDARVGADAGACSTTSTSFFRRAISGGGATSISSACSIRARRSSSRAAARGTARSAARGRSTAAATASRRRKRRPRTCCRSTSPTSSSSTTSRSSIRSTASRSAHEIEKREDQKAVLPRDPRRRAAAATARCSATGASSGWSTCSWASRRSTRRG